MPVLVLDRSTRHKDVPIWKTNNLEVRVPIATGLPDFYTAYLQTIDAQ